VSALRPIPPPLKVPLLLYRCALPLVTLFLAPGFFSRMRRRGGCRENFGQRFGRFSMPVQTHAAQGRWNWIHSISVGETLVALKLAKALRAAQPDIRIALSVTTSTGLALAREAESDWLLPLYNPWDTRRIVRRTLDLLRPERLILIEGEIWPNLLTECHQRRIPVVLANARLSPRSARRFARFQSWTSPFFNLLEWIAVPDAEDIPRWQSIGVEPGKLRLTGSIKFDQAAPMRAPLTERLRTLLGHAGIPDDSPLLVAGSTHAGEEMLIARLLPEWRKTQPGLHVVLVPRHVERTESILEELAPLGLSIQRRSRLLAETPPPSHHASPPDILLVDTTGELRDWYTLATLIFVGKSLTGGGGQNPVEAALAGKPVLFGPLMENFETAVAQLLAAEGAQQVADASALQAAVESLLRDPAGCERMSRNAQRAMEGHQGASARTAQLVLDTPVYSPAP
jgi:3-deoxy-D-manno-octulosonic-acid transferase